MPVSSNSRYARQSIFEATDQEGNNHATIGTRLSSDAEVSDSAYRHVLSGDESMESLAAQVFGSSDQWWRIADANPPVFPLDTVPGMSISISSVGASITGRIERTRKF